jgi:cytochrome P450
MGKFVDLGISFFDPDFTLSPYEYLQELYPREDILGFHSEGMNFVFRFDEARAVMFNRQCAREPLANPEIAEREMRLAREYPNRAKNFQLGYTHGTPNLALKKLLKNYIAQIAESADFTDTEAVYRRLSGGGRLENYIDDICTLPLRIMLVTSGLPFNEAQLSQLYRAGFDFIKALDNFVDESPLAAADRSVAEVWDYLEEALERADPGSPIARLMTDGAEQGIDRETMIVNIGAFLVITLSNTAGVSSAYLLRNLVNHPDIRHTLRDSPDLLDSDHVIMEFLRRDNHVKALSRQAHAGFELHGQEIAAGDSVNIFFPGINLDPGHWERPLEIDLQRQFSGENNIIFGGSMYMCIGKQLGIAFLKNMARGFVAHLPDTARVVESEIEVDGDWVSERVITRMPIELA